MEPDNGRIPTHSRQQAMDLSLVLLSQGIEATIDAPDDQAHWSLLVPASQVPEAWTAIELYRAENRRRLWRREIASSGVLFDWASLGWLLLLCVFYWLSGVHPDVRAAGMMDSDAVSVGQWERLFTATWLHADLGHLGRNGALGLVLTGLVMGRFGGGLGLLAAYLTGVGGNLFVWGVTTSPHLSLGASGIVMGCVGLLAMQPISLRTRKLTPAASAAARAGALKPVATAFAAATMLFVLLGLSPGSDIAAHFGGFLTGLLLGVILALAPPVPLRTGWNFSFGLIFLALTVWPWFRAFTNAG